MEQVAQVELLVEDVAGGSALHPPLQLVDLLAKALDPFSLGSSVPVKLVGEAVQQCRTFIAIERLS